MRDRVIGIENEYGAVTRASDGAYSHEEATFPRSDIAGFQGKLAASADKRVLESVWRVGRLWLSNGGCVYVDAGEHIEYASPEARRFRDVVRYNKAGERILGDLFPVDENGKRIVFLKHNVAQAADRESASPVSFGCHENYLFFGEMPQWAAWPPSREEKTPPFLPFVVFLVTRQIMDGAGRWVQPEKDVFGFSQRALFVKEVINADSTVSRAILNTRNEHHTRGASHLRRLHLICGDANILEYALYLKVSTTALVLSMYEDGAVLPFADIFTQPVQAMHTLASCHDSREKCLDLGDGVTRSPLEIQCAFAEAARRYCRNTSFESEESEAEAHEAVGEWERTLNALARNDKKWLVGRLDYVTKYALASAHITRGGTRMTLEEKAALRRGIDLAYHNTTAPLAALAKLLERFPEKRIITEDSIQAAKRIPPSDTRAYARGTIIARYASEGRALDLGTIGWDYVSTYHDALTFVCGDPLCATPSWLQDFLLGKPPRELAGTRAPSYDESFMGDPELWCGG